MLYHFQSDAAAEILMLGSHAKPIVRLMGKDEHAKEGIITVAQIPAALQSLQQAIAQEREGATSDRQATHQQNDEEAHPATAEPVVTLAMRSQPLQAMLQASAKADKPVTWFVE